MATPPVRTEISDTYPNPTNAVARAGFGKLYDYVTGLLGSTGNAPEARAAIGAVNIAGDNLTGTINDKRSTVALTATTSPIWTAGTGKIIDGTGTPTITDFPAAPQAGAQREIYPPAGAIMTHGGNISVQGNANHTAAAGDKWVITAITTTTFYVEVIPKNALPIVGSINAKTAVATTSGTSVNFTGIPAWAKRITVSFAGVSTNGTSVVQVRVGTSSGVVITGYSSSASNISGAVSSSSTTDGFSIMATSAAVVDVHGSFVLTLLDASTNTWSASGTLARTDTAATLVAAGSISLAAVLNQVSITTSGGTDVFDGGKVNILYE